MKKLSLASWLVPAAITFAAPAQAVSSAELYRTDAAFYGRFEARIRFAPTDGVVSSFFLWKEGSETSGAYWNELDFEKLGADCHLQTNAIFGAPSVEHPQVDAVADACGAYHTYAFEWAPSYISWQIDGAEVRRDTTATAAAFAQNASAGMAMHFNVWPGDASFGGNFNAANLPVHQYISWVQYSSYENGSFALKWREDFDATTAPSSWATGNWASPKAHSTHSPANVTFADGIAILSLTSDDATGFTGSPPSDAVAGGSGVAGTSGGGGASNGGAGVGGGGAASAAGGQSMGDPGVGGLGHAGSGGSPTGAGGSTGTSVGIGGAGVGNSAGDGISASGTATDGEPTKGSSGSCSCRLPINGRSSNAAGALALGVVMILAGRRRAAKPRR